MPNPKLFICQSHEFEDFGAVFYGAFDVHKAGKVEAAHIFFPGKEQQHVVPFSLDFNGNFMCVATFQFV